MYVKNNVLFLKNTNKDEGIMFNIIGIINSIVFIDDYNEFLEITNQKNY